MGSVEVYGRGISIWAWQKYVGVTNVVCFNGAEGGYLIVTLDSFETKTRQTSGGTLRQNVIDFAFPYRVTLDDILAGEFVIII